MQIPHFNEGDNIGMGNVSSLKHLAEIAEEFLAAAAISDQQLAIDQLVTDHLVNAQKPIQFGREWLAAHERPNPHRRIDQDH